MSDGRRALGGAAVEAAGEGFSSDRAGYLERDTNVSKSSSFEV